jgi:hypothetical protein
MMAQCRAPYQVQSADWYYTIPTNYQGFLVIRYECTGGNPLVVQDEKIYVRFNDNGTACIKDKFLPTKGQIFAQDKNGQSIRYVGSPWHEKGYGLYIDGTQSMERGGIDYGTFEVLWVGDMEYLATHYLRGLDQFLEDRFGVPQVKIVVTPTPP